MDTIDLDSSFDSPFRARSNTWPLPRPDPLETFLPSNDDLSEENLELSETTTLSESSANLPALNNITLNSDTIIPTTAHELCEQTVNGQNGQVNGLKKNSSRRNAWGNMSYADLITQAIQSSPEKRLTLSQIYDWMVQNVPYFKDKGDSNSSAGWKNSIRHNLSLHSRFMRVQNEGTGKSSWWMINPEAKPGKAARRRATSMETKTYEKKRGRVKKKIEALRNGYVLDTTPSPSSSISEGLDMFDESPLHVNFQLSPDFRPRASSNASSCGRLSPIPAAETDLHDNQVPPSSPLNSGNWSTDLGKIYNGGDLKDQFNTEKLVEMANTMKLGSNAFINVAQSSPNSDSLSPNASHIPLNGGGYNIGLFQTGSLNYNSTNGTLHRNGSDPYFQNPSAIENSVTLTSLNSVPTPRSPGKLMSTDALSPSSYSLSNMSPSISPTQSMDTLLSAITTTNSSNFSNKNTNAHQTQANGGTNYSLNGNLINRANNNNNNNKGLLSSSNISLTSLGSTATQVMEHLLSLNNPMPNDLDLNFDSLQGGLECDVDQVIRHELSVDGNLDFNFDPLHGTAAQPATVVSTSMASASSHSWVH